MGDRANFGFEQSNGDIVFLYGHWAGEGMLDTLATALDFARPRWYDEAYGTRMAISHIVGEGHDGELGWGITANYICDNEHSIPVVNWFRGTVSLFDYTMVRGSGFSLTEKKFEMSIEDFVKKFQKSLTNA